MAEGAYWAVLTAPILECNTISDGAKLFYAQVSRRTNERGYCWASNRTLSEELGVCERTVSRYVAELERAGFVSTEFVGVSDRKRRGERHIRLAVPAPFDLAKNGDLKVDKNVYPKVDKNVHLKVDKNGEVNNMLNNNITPPTPQRGGGAVDDLLKNYAAGDAELLEALKGFAENRRQLKKPMKSARMVALLTGKLDKLSGGSRAVKIAMLDKAVTHNWQTVYELDERELAELKAEMAKKPAPKRWAGTKIVDGEEVDVYE